MYLIKDSLTQACLPCAPARCSLPQATRREQGVPAGAPPEQGRGHHLRYQAGKGTRALPDPAHTWGGSEGDLWSAKPMLLHTTVCTAVAPHTHKVCAEPSAGALALRGTQALSDLSSMGQGLPLSQHFPCN